MKTPLKILLAVALAAIVLFLAGRYGWRLIGFSACDDPNSNYVEDVIVAGDSVRVTGGTASSMSAYVGCIHCISNGNLYLGVKHNALLGFFRRIGAFSATVPLEGQTVGAVYFKGGGRERLIWTQADGLIRPADTQG